MPLELLSPADKTRR